MPTIPVTSTLLQWELTFQISLSSSALTDNFRHIPSRYLAAKPDYAINGPMFVSGGSND
jgi:hypothetical protein